MTERQFSNTFSLENPGGFHIDGISDLEMQQEVLRRMLNFLGVEDAPVIDEVRDWMLVQ